MENNKFQITKNDEKLKQKILTNLLKSAEISEENIVSVVYDNNNDFGKVTYRKGEVNFDRIILYGKMVDPDSTAYREVTNYQKFGDCVFFKTENDERVVKDYEAFKQGKIAYNSRKADVKTSIDEIMDSVENEEFDTETWICVAGTATMVTSFLMNNAVQHINPDAGQFFNMTYLVLGAGIFAYGLGSAMNKQLSKSKSVEKLKQIKMGF